MRASFLEAAQQTADVAKPLRVDASHDCPAHVAYLSNMIKHERLQAAFITSTRVQSRLWGEWPRWQQEA